MANRTYMYSTNFIPSPDIIHKTRHISGIAEWNYQIPVAAKILLSGNPRKCRSLLWDQAEEVAIIGNYEQGVANLIQFLDRLTLPEIIPLRTEARQFLTDQKHKNSYFLLECSEIFVMGDASLLEQNERLLSEIQNREAVIEASLAAFSELPSGSPKPASFFAQLFGVRSAMAKIKRTEAIYSLGLGNWSDHLYFDLSDESSSGN